MGRSGKSMACVRVGRVGRWVVSGYSLGGSMGCIYRTGGSTGCV